MAQRSPVKAGRSHIPTGEFLNPVSQATTRPPTKMMVSPNKPDKLELPNLECNHDSLTVNDSAGPAGYFSEKAGNNPAGRGMRFTDKKGPFKNRAAV
jgi:hypothetical protein